MNVRVRLAFHRPRGSALIAALFLIVVVAALGTFAVRLQANQQQVATLQVLESRANAAAHAGLEYWSNRLATGACGVQDLLFTGIAGLRGFTVRATCTQVNTGTATLVYEITSTAQSSGAFGTPDFVQRTLRRRVQTVPAVYD